MRIVTTTGQEEIFRGMRRDIDNVGFERPRSRELDSGFSFWAVDQAYAAEFGPILLTATMAKGARILDITDADVDGGELIAVAPSVAKALKIDADDLVDRLGIWERIQDDVEPLAQALRADGFDAVMWLEYQYDVALFVANHEVLKVVSCAEG